MILRDFMVLIILRNTRHPRLFRSRSSPDNKKGTACAVPSIFISCPKLGSEFLAQFSLFTTPLAQEIQTGASGMSTTLDGHFLNDGGPGQESPFNTDAIAGNTSNGKTLAISLAVNPDDRAFKLLDSFVIAFFDANKNSNSISGLHIRDIGVLWRFKRLDQLIHPKFPSK